MTNETDLPMLTSLIAGGTAGITVDVTLFPLDTLKTRLQSPCGFFASGGFQHLYKGVRTAAVGSVPSGGIAAAVTTPLDVAKTRIMLAEKNIHSQVDCARLHTSTMLINIYREQGVQGLFAGFVPRVLWITLGGAVFFGAYQAAVDFCSQFDVLR